MDFSGQKEIPDSIKNRKNFHKDLRIKKWPEI